MAASVTILLVDDHPSFVRGLQVLLPRVDARLHVVGTTHDASAAGALAHRLLPDLVLVDLLMPEPGGLRAIAAVRRTEPRCRVVALSGTDDPDLVVAAFEAGAHGFLRKDTEVEELVPALLAVAAGSAVLPDDTLEGLLDTRRRRGRAADLGGAERLLWRRLAQGVPTPALAAELHVSERTAKRMTAVLLRKLGVGTRMEAAVLAGEEGLLDGGR